MAPFHATKKAADIFISADMEPNHEYYLSLMLLERSQLLCVTFTEI
jgi:hypothetical protein